MKYFTIILFSLFTLNIFADGGSNYNHRSVSIDNFEPNLNLQFIGIKDTVHYLDKKKNLTAIVYSNIAVYDIANNKTNYIFNDSASLQIVGFYFESKYIDEHKTIEFNNSYYPSDSYEPGLFEHSNNRNVSSRPISHNLIIVTEDLLTNNLTFWICDKHGNNLKKVLEISGEWIWEIDVKNMSIRATRQVNKKVEIQNIKY